MPLTFLLGWLAMQWAPHSQGTENHQTFRASATTPLSRAAERLRSTKLHPGRLPLLRHTSLVLQLQGRVVQDVYGEITSNYRVLRGPKRPPSVALAALSALLCPVASSFSRDLYPLQLKERSSSRLTAIQLPVFSTEGFILKLHSPLIPCLACTCHVDTYQLGKGKKYNPG